MAAVRPLEGLSPDEHYRTSRYVHIRPTEHGMLVEHCLHGHSFLATPAQCHVLCAMTSPTRARDIVGDMNQTVRVGVLAFLERCWSDGYVTRVDECGVSDEEPRSLAHWEFHDLLFHTRSRRGRTLAPVGATYHRRGQLEPAPAYKDSNATEGIPLYRPDIEQLKRGDRSLTDVLERRRSVYSTEPLSSDQLGELLYRTCRMTTRAEGPYGPAFRRVYPSGGSLHPLEVYVVSVACTGLDRGVFLYRPIEHVLIPIAGITPDVESLLHEAQLGTGDWLATYPAVLLVMTARFRRVMWKYQSLAYSLVLKEVGALYQTMYLVATAMELAPCALGTGDADRFARIAGLNYYEETSVGEFVLGGRTAATRVPTSGEIGSPATAP
jgi:oxazoline/thiazoline dehydrogenase